jgi:hypothetical protein
LANLPVVLLSLVGVVEIPLVGPSSVLVIQQQMDSQAIIYASNTEHQSSIFPLAQPAFTLQILAIATNLICT